VFTGIKGLRGEDLSLAIIHPARTRSQSPHPDEEHLKTSSDIDVTLTDIDVTSSDIDKTLSDITGSLTDIDVTSIHGPDTHQKCPIDIMMITIDIISMTKNDT